jgi:hypothetical protein
LTVPSEAPPTVMLAGLIRMDTFGSVDVAVGTRVEVAVGVPGTGVTGVAVGVPGRGVSVAVAGMVVDVGGIAVAVAVGPTGVGVKVEVKMGVAVGGVGDNGVGVAVALLVCRIVRL